MYSDDPNPNPKPSPNNPIPNPNSGQAGAALLARRDADAPPDARDMADAGEAATACRAQVRRAAAPAGG